MKMNEQKKYYSCDCEMELIKIERDDELGGIDFSIYVYGTGDNKTSLKDKLRYCWRILKTGRPYGDQIILSFETAKQMAMDLLNLIKSKRGKKK